MIKVKKRPGKKSPDKLCHDLRNLLTIMKIQTELLDISGDRQEREEKLKEFRKAINRGINQMVEMLT